MIDPRLVDLKKAFDASSTNGNSSLTPAMISKIISEYARIQPAIRNVIPRISWPTDTYSWANRLTPGTANTITEMATLSVSDGQFSKGQARMSQFAFLGLLSDYAISVDQPLVDVKELAIKGATAAMLRTENKTILRGDALNSQNPGLFAAILAGPNGNVFGSGLAANYSLFSNMDILLRAKGYVGGAFVVSPRVYQVVTGAAFNRVRFLSVQDKAQYGFPLENDTAVINGIPLIMDPYAEVPTAVASETLANTSGDNVTFPISKAFVYLFADDNQAGDSWTAPVVKVGGATKVAGTDYSITQTSLGATSVVFKTTPGGTVTVSYTYGADNVLLINLDPDTLVVAENRPLQLDQDIANPYDQLASPVRMSMFATLAVRNPKAHLYVPNVSIPAISAF